MNPRLKPSLAPIDTVFIVLFTPAAKLPLPVKAWLQPETVYSILKPASCGVITSVQVTKTFATSHSGASLLPITKTVELTRG